MSVRCSSCATEIEDGIPVCPECGTRVPSPPDAAPSSELRRLTIMCPDLIGSTRLAQTLEPEVWHELLAHYQRECVKVIERWGGNVAQHTGDGIFVYFGYPTTFEDDARRAVGAALEITRVVPLLQTPAGIPPLGVRVGVDSGPTVVGTIGSGRRRENLAVGSVPNLASHIEKRAHRNGVVVSDSTRRLVQGYYEFEPLEGDLGDVEGSIRLFRVLRATGAARFIDAAVAVGLTQFIGRDAELIELQGSWGRAIEGAGTTVLVRGEAGIGKSRLIQEFKRFVSRAPCEVFEWHCSEDAQGTPLRPVAEAIARRFEITEDDPVDARLAKLERGLAELGVTGDEPVWLFASLLSIPSASARRPQDTSPQSIRKKTLESLLSVVRALSAERALLLVVEDLHWADPSTLELIGLAMEKNRDARIMTVLTCRPVFRAPWQTEPIQTEVQRLSRVDTERMITQVAHGRTLPPDVVEELTYRSEGLPFVIEELTRAVLESGVLADHGDHYELSKPLDTAIPPNVSASLTTRLHRLGATKRTAQVASVIGRTFGYATIRLVADRSEAELQSDLEQLARADLLYASGDPQDPQWTFKHALIKEAAYASLLGKQRRALHEKIADVLVERFPETANA
ncbi:MAG TPA: AAA family ATPase, partial [Polyangiaceae bacterium]